MSSMQHLFGVVEIRKSWPVPAGHWKEIIHLEDFFYSDFNIHGCFFGVNNVAHFRPLFPNRGEPIDASDYVLGTPEGQKNQITYLSFRELSTINWNENAEGYSDLIYKYEIEDNGNLKFHVAASPSILLRSEIDVASKLLTQNEVESNGCLYKRKILKRRDAVENTDFNLFMTLVSAAAKMQGEEAVRVIAWFHHDD